jgi:hypothetical protein
MYDDRDLARAVGSAARRGIAVKAAIVAAMLAIVGLFLIAPFAATDDMASASCLPPGAGDSDDSAASSPALRAVQIVSAKLIDDVAVARGLPGRATLVALMTALQESQLQNLGYGDRDSLGLFQQRPSAGWGTPEQILDPRYGIEAFFGGSQPPSPPGLVDIDGWMSMPYTEAAQAVQVSAFPDAYARQEQLARAIAAQAGIDLNRPGNPYAGRATPPSVEPAVRVFDGCGGSVDLQDSEAVDARWPQEEATVVDPTGTGGMVTPRTAAWVALIRSTMDVPSMTCWDAHAWNPTSDHPKGRACDAMVGADARKSAAERELGSRIANWAVQTASQTGVHYVIWYGQIWTARTGQWRPYDGGGIYNPNDANGGHYNHVHVSLY